MKQFFTFLSPTVNEEEEGKMGNLEPSQKVNTSFEQSLRKSITVVCVTFVFLFAVQGAAVGQTFISGSYNLANNNAFGATDVIATSDVTLSKASTTLGSDITIANNFAFNGFNGTLRSSDTWGGKLVFTGDFTGLDAISIDGTTTWSYVVLDGSIDADIFHAVSGSVELNAANTFNNVQIGTNGRVGLGHNEAFGTATTVVTLTGTPLLYKSVAGDITIANNIDAGNNALALQNIDAGSTFTFTGDITNATDIYTSGDSMSTTDGLIALGKNVAAGTNLYVTSGTTQWYDPTGGTGSTTLGNLELGVAYWLPRTNKTLIVGTDTDTGYSDLVVNDFASYGGKIEFKVGTDGWWNMLTINGTITGYNTTSTEISLAGPEANLNRLGGRGNGEIALVTHNGIGDSGSFRFNRNQFATSRYVFDAMFGADGNVWELYESITTPVAYSSEGVWGYGISSNAATFALPDVSTFVMANTVAFDLPRAQWTNGPWAIFKGGELNDSASAFRNHSFQDLQVGFDRTLGQWNVGAFFESAWLWGRGELDPLGMGVIGGLRSSNKGVAGGLTLGRVFRNKTHIDVVGRVTRFDNEAKYNDYTNATDNYNATWKSNLFSLGLEVGRHFKSRDGRWSFNPYNRLIYHSAGAKSFDVVYNDGSAPTVATVQGFGTWTNRLGVRLTLNDVARRGGVGYYGQSPCDEVSCNPCDPCGSGNGYRVNRMYFVGADWYKGICGTFGDVLYVDPVVGSGTLALARARNNLSYGKAIAGVTFLPRSNVGITFTGETLFGDVNGYGLTAAAKVAF